MTKVLIPLDGSSLSEEPLAFGLGLVEGAKHSITLLSCADPEKWIMPERGSTGWFERQEKAEKDKLRSYLEKKKRALEKDGHWVFLRTPVGQPVSEILKEAEKVDLILMSSQGRSGFKRFFVGSVAEEVLRKASCPVLLIPPKERRK